MTGDRPFPLVVVAPDTFKGSLTAAEAAAALARGLRRRLPGVRVVEHPIADGGEGSVEMVLRHGFRPVSCEVHGPTGEPVAATYALLGDTALVEMAEAAGLGLLPEGGPDDRTARTASTYGVGELVRDALDKGARRIVLAVGGSATTDGGAGMAAALGARTWTASGPVRPVGGAHLIDVERLDVDGLDARLPDAAVVVACDVDNPLTGPSGAAAVYGPQKGATAETVALLDRALNHWADLVTASTGRDLRGLPGAGAAGGLGFGAASLLGAEVRSGIDTLLELSGFARTVAGADLVIVGEGSLDEQSLHGKGPIGVATAAARAGARVVAVAGRSTVPLDRLRAVGIDDVHTLSELEPDTGRSMRQAADLLETIAERIAAAWLRDGTERPPAP
ncbi:glycerate kinase [Blastococcus sp. CT_GayMR20]|uniref:glycerate kinase n=1 Tax=Blastococcus sp. CT_GayMR20 TaxID=2559609 RepID=UPI001ADD966C|nr:glycerate kinase [Blastococcus sp. CT_GayMR20]